jgi:hypothetical protein
MIAKTAHRKSVAAWLMSMFATVGFTPMEPTCWARQDGVVG